MHTALEELSQAVAEAKTNYKWKMPRTLRRSRNSHYLGLDTWMMSIWIKSDWH
ncbi:MAG: hypothetical protein RLZZ293_464 [Pseudomonadota bacterium]